MIAADIVKLSEHVEVSLAEYWRINVRCLRMLLRLFSIFCFLLSGFVIVNPVAGFSITFIIRMLISAHSIASNPVPCTELCIEDSLVLV